MVAAEWPIADYAVTSQVIKSENKRSLKKGGAVVERARNSRIPLHPSPRLSIIEQCVINYGPIIIRRGGNGTVSKMLSVVRRGGGSR